MTTNLPAQYNQNVNLKFAHQKEHDSTKQAGVDLPICTDSSHAHFSNRVLAIILNLYYQVNYYYSLNIRILSTIRTKPLFLFSRGVLTMFTQA